MPSNKKRVRYGRAEHSEKAAGSTHRSGASAKNVIIDEWLIRIEVPRDREGTLPSYWVTDVVPSITPLSAD